MAPWRPSEALKRAGIGGGDASPTAPIAASLDGKVVGLNEVQMPVTGASPSALTHLTFDDERGKEVRAGLSPCRAGVAPPLHLIAPAASPLGFVRRCFGTARHMCWGRHWKRRMVIAYSFVMGQLYCMRTVRVAAGVRRSGPCTAATLPRPLQPASSTSFTWETAATSFQPPL